MNTSLLGNRAETVACEYLKSHGYKVIERNWKTKLCEIDIIAENGEAVYLVEVKYRRTPDYGDGLDVIDNRKLNKLRLAAKIWHNSHSDCMDFGVLIIYVEGNDFRVKDCIEL